jgi:hypothetical protein
MSSRPTSSTPAPTRTHVPNARPAPPRTGAERRAALAHGPLPLVAVAVAFTLAQLLWVVPRVDLGWDEAVYVSQVTPHIPAAYFSAPRARGVPVLVAPLAFVTSSTHALRVYLALLSGGALLLGLTVWRRLRPVPEVALAGLLFGGLWVTQLYGPLAMPNLWVALGGVIAVGCFLRAAGPAGGAGGRPAARRRGPLAGLVAALAAVALFRPSDSFWLALPLALAALLVPRWRRPALLVALVGGLALGSAQWVVEAYVSYGGVPQRLARSSDIEGGIGWHPAFGNQLRTLDGLSALCRPCTVPWRHHADATWWFALPALAAGGAALAVATRRRADAAATLLPLAAGLSLAVPYLLLIGYAAPRFLLPAYALLAFPVARLLAWPVQATARRGLTPRALAWVLVAGLVGLQLGSQHTVLSRSVNNAAAGNGDYAQLADTLRRWGVRPPCLVTGPLATPVGYQAHCASGQTSGHNENTTTGRIERTARHDPVAVLVRGRDEPPSFAAHWTDRPVDGLHGHISAYRVYLSPTAVRAAPRAHTPPARPAHASAHLPARHRRQ